MVSIHALTTQDAQGQDLFILVKTSLKACIFFWFIEVFHHACSPRSSGVPLTALESVEAEGAAAVEALQTQLEGEFRAKEKKPQSAAAQAMVWCIFFV